MTPIPIYSPLLVILLLGVPHLGSAETLLPAVIRATECKATVTVDGVLSEEIWNSAPVQHLSLSNDRLADVQEGGRIQVVISDDTLYLAARLKDSDVLQESNENQARHFQSGDVLELFLKPKKAPYYWELYVTPNELKTVYFFEGGGRRFLPSAYTQPNEWLRVAATVQGTFNDPSDRDQGWTAEMAIPLKTLAEKGVPLDGEHPWTILIGRYNYSLHLPERELSMSPAQPATNFHTPEFWAELRIIP